MQTLANPLPFTADAYQRSAATRLLRTTTLDTCVLSSLARYGKAASLRVIADRVGASRMRAGQDAVRSALGRLVAAGKVREQRRGSERVWRAGGSP